MKPLLDLKTELHFAAAGSPGEDWTAHVIWNHHQLKGWGWLLHLVMNPSGHSLVLPGQSLNCLEFLNREMQLRMNACLQTAFLQTVVPRSPSMVKEQQ